MFLLMLEEVSSELTTEIIEAVASSEPVAEATSEGVSIPSAVQPVADWIKTAWDWLNQPLPIVGISVIAILIFLWRVFVSTNYGKKTIKKLTAIGEETKSSTAKALEEARAENEKLRAELEEMRGQVNTAYEVLEKVCENSRNKKVKDLTEALKTKEEEKGVTDNGEEGQEGIDGNSNEE